MEFNAFREKCLNIFALNPILPTPTDEQIEKLMKLTGIMLEVNKSMNLTAITEENAVILRHYADSLTILSDIPQGASLIDVGCGAGFPSLPLAIFRPDVRITSLDGTAKRIEYVKNTARELGLTNLTAVAARAEEYAKMSEYRESFDIATARAVANLPVLTELCLPFVKKGGRFIAMKAAQGDNEAAAAENAVKLCGGEIAEISHIGLTADGKEFENRVIVKVNKVAQTPAKYPRHYSQISKKPL